MAERATEPFLDPVEMQNTQAGVVATVRRKYGPLVRKIYGDAVFLNEDRAFNAIALRLPRLKNALILPPLTPNLTSVFCRRDWLISTG